MSASIKIDPRKFITGPFKKCPKCGGEEFGILRVGPDCYTRRCRDFNCWHTVELFLPQIKKKVIYIDQCAFSEIMKVLSPEIKGHERAVSEPLWRDLYELLDVVCHLQLAVCPDSLEHEHESLASPFYEPLKHTYEHFSCGLSFEYAQQVKSNQIATAARCFARREELRFDFDAEKVVHGRIHVWQDRIFVTTSGVLPGQVEALRHGRSQAHAGLQKVFERWQREKKSFGEVFEQEINSYVPLIVQQLQRDQQNILQIMNGQMPPSLEALLPSQAAEMLGMLNYIFARESAPAKPTVTVADFFSSGLTNKLPFNVIESAMFASLSLRAASGQKKMPDQGTINDISVVSTLLPYCDAMFVDNGCRALLQNIPKKDKLPYPCSVFSKNIGQEFVAYLRSIRDSVTPEHLKIIEDAYGPRLLKPRGIYGVGVHKRAEVE